MSCDALSEVIPCFMNDILENNFTAGLLPLMTIETQFITFNFLRFAQRAICLRFNLVNAQFIIEIQLTSNLINRSSVNTKTFKSHNKNILFSLQHLPFHILTTYRRINLVSIGINITQTVHNQEIIPSRERYHSTILVSHGWPYFL